MEEYASEVTLLRKCFWATPTAGLKVKRVKFLELADCLTIHYHIKEAQSKVSVHSSEASLSRVIFEKGGEIQALILLVFWIVR